MRQEQKQQDSRLVGQEGGPRGEAGAAGCFAASPGVSQWWWRLFPSLWDHMHPSTCLIHRLPGVSALLRVLQLAEAHWPAQREEWGASGRGGGGNAVTTISLPDNAI